MTLRRRQVAAAQALYGALGVTRDDRAGRDAQFERNFRFFDAPVALVVTLEHGFGSGGYMDLGMTLYGLMLAAQAKGLATCAIGAMASYPSLIRQHLGLDEGSVIVCGMALGYADPDAPPHSLDQRSRAQTARTRNSHQALRTRLRRCFQVRQQANQSHSSRCTYGVAPCQ
eukprot:gene17656-21596_t